MTLENFAVNLKRCRVVPKNDFNGKPTKILRYVVRNPESMVQSWKFWDLSRAHSNVYHELKHGNNGQGWTIMEITREGLNKNTKYKVRNANLTNANLTNANLTNANLAHAGFSGANLDRATLSKANLDRAYLARSKDIPIPKNEAEYRGAYV